jgi:hypothetical protein
LKVIVSEGLAKQNDFSWSEVDIVQFNRLSLGFKEGLDFL